jgi:phage terminase large subunit-like protein
MLAAPVDIESLDLEYVARLPATVMEAVIADMSDEDAMSLYYTWRFKWSEWARWEQRAPPGTWRYWVCIAGRGGGKTKTGAEWVNQMALERPGCHIGLLAATAADARDTMAAAILEASPPWFTPRYLVSARRLIWPNGSYATTYSADEPEQTRGANLHYGWVDELGKFRDIKTAGNVTAWENFHLAVRIGLHPQVLVTTTPRRIGRGAEFVKDLVLGKKVNGRRPCEQPPGDPAVWRPRPNTVVHRWSTDRNKMNVAASFLDDLAANYGGTVLEAQEIRADILDEVAGALWSMHESEAGGATIAPWRVTKVPRIVRLLVAIDPSHAEMGGYDEAGIIVAGLGDDGHVYIMADASMRGSPLAWAQEAIAVYNRYRADAIVYEVNTVQSEKMANVVKDTISTVDPSNLIKWVPVRATRDKATRAEPVAALYEQGRVHHVGEFEVLEDEMVSWDRTSKNSPNRMDALVWAVTALLLDGSKPETKLL